MQYEFVKPSKEELLVLDRVTEKTDDCIVINAAKTSDVVSYFYDAKKERFGFGCAYINHYFKATHEIIVDAGLFAQDLDAIFDEVLFS